MTSLPAAQHALASCLEELERLGLARPASVLVTEYLAALTAEKMIDAETATRVAAAWHRLRYGTVDPIDAEVRDATARLQAAVQAVAEMSDTARRDLVERMSGRLKMTADGTEAPAAGEPPVRPGLDWRSLGPASEPASDDSDSPNSLPRVDRQAEAKPATVGRGVRVRSLPLEAVTVVLVALVAAGYVLRGGIDRSIGPGEAKAPTSEKSRVAPQDVWMHDDYWASNLRRRALREAGQKRDQTARMAYELLLTQVPHDPGALNELAWLLLTSEDVTVRDPKRGLELALRALAFNRSPAILDTAAEGRFQTGQPAEAVKLEEEAIDTLPRFPGFEDKRFLLNLLRQLEKFREAAGSAASGG